MTDVCLHYVYGNSPAIEKRKLKKSYTAAGLSVPCLHGTHCACFVISFPATRKNAVCLRAKEKGKVRIDIKS